MNLDSDTIVKPEFNGRTILVVDDNPANLALLSEYLKDFGFKLLIAQDGMSALEKAALGKPDLILLDVMMPDMDGFETCRRLKENESLRDIPIIFTTALSDTESKIAGLQLGAVDYITKPFQPEEALARVRTHLALRGMQKQLELQNVQLQEEIAERKRAESELQKAHDELEQRVIERTAELARANESLTVEITERKRAEEIALKNEARYRSLFEDSPASLWEEDWSEAKLFFDELKAKGVTDFYRHFKENPQDANLCFSKIKIVDVNRVGVHFYDAHDKKDILLSLSEIASQESRDVLLKEIAAIASGQLAFESEDVAVSFTGQKRHVIFRLGVVQGYEDSLGKVLLSVIDIDARKRAEEELQQRNRELIAASDILRLATTHLDMKTILNETLRGAIALTGTEGGAICMTDPVQNLSIVASFQVDREKLTAIDKQLCRNVFETGAPLVLNADSAETSTPKTLEEIRFHAMFPIRVKDHTIGILCVFTRKENKPSARSLELLRGLCGPIGLAIENARLFKRTEQQVQRLTALREIDIAIVSGGDMKLTLDVLSAHALTQLGADAVDILYCDPVAEELLFVTGHGFKSDQIKETRLQFGEGVAGKAVLEQTVLYSDDLSNDPKFTRHETLKDEGFVSYIGIPLISKKEPKGIMEVFFRKPFDFSGNWMEFLEALAGQASIAIENTQLFENLQRSNKELSLAYESTLEGWAKALELRDKETEGHSRRVTDLTIRLAKRLGIGNSHLIHMRRGVLLHDIGKMGVPDIILHKTGPLDEDEMGEMRYHPQYAYDLLAPISYLQPALDIPWCHHEKWDGSGYPRGLKGNEIPLAARIFAVVDVWDALLSNRPYRKAWSRKKTLNYIKQEAGKYFDPKVVKAFIQMIEEDEGG